MYGDTRLREKADRGGCVTLVSVPLLLEYEAVLTRREHLKETGLTVTETIAVVDALAAAAEPVALRFLWRPRLEDPSDEMVLETAVNGAADHFSTFNVRHLRKAVQIFGIRVTLPGQLWREIGSAQHEKE